jgi:hypothetical protein
MSSPMLVPRDALQIDIQSLDGLNASGKTFVKPVSFSFTRPLHCIFSRENDTVDAAWAVHCGPRSHTLNVASKRSLVWSARR